MKSLLLAFSLLSVLSAHSQLLYDPTVIYDEAGSGKLYDLESLHDIHLTFYESDYHAILSGRWFSKDENRLPAELDMESIHYDSVGVKYKGNSTFFIANLLGNPKVPYNIDLNYYTSGAKLLGYKKLKLANALFDPTFAKEALASHVYRHYLPTLQVSVVRLTVNDTYLGAFVNTESTGKQWLKKHFNEKNGTFVKCEPIAQFGSTETFVPADLVYEGTDTMNYYESYEIKSDSIDQSWSEFIDFMDVLNNDPSNLENVLNIDRVLWYFAVTTVLPNEDAYNTMVMHNYYLYKTGDGKFQFIPWDLSETFCGAMIGQLTKADHYEREPFYGYNPLLLDHPLVYRILSVPYYQKRMIHHVRTVINEFYDQSQLKAWAEELQATAYDAVDEDPNKIFGMDEYVENLDNNTWWFTTEIAGIVETMDNRKPFLEAHPEILKVPPTISSVNQSIEHPSSSETVYISTNVTNADNVYLRVTSDTTPYASNFPKIEMLDDGLGGDISAGDGIYTAAVPFTTTNDYVKYYIEAENSEAIALMPERAEYYYYHYYVDQVVSVEELYASRAFYPNPATDFVTIQTNTKETHLQLFDLNGRLYLDEELIGVNLHQIDLKTVGKGTYVVVLSGTGGMRTEKLIIR